MSIPRIGRPSLARGAAAPITCATCHLVPDPSLVTRKVWEEFVLPKMSFYTGVHQLDPNENEEADLDIAAVGFYPDCEHSPQESFVYWENLGGLKFKPYTFRECISGRWLTMDVGDLDGDGDLDIVLGSLIRMPSAAPEFVKDIWERVGPSVLILKNTLRKPKP